MLEYYRSGYKAVTKMEHYNIRFFLDNNLSIFFLSVMWLNVAPVADVAPADVAAAGR